MTFLVRVLVVVSMLTVTAGCIGLHPAAPPVGVLYDNTTVPVRPEEQMKHRGNVRATKGGRACSYSVLGLVSWGDSSLGKAIRAGGITTVTSVDASHTGSRYFYTGKVCTVVEGN